jgi:hypothetical protein
MTMWESTTDALKLLPSNSLTAQYQTRSPPHKNSKKAGSAKRGRGPEAVLAASLENCGASEINSPPAPRYLKRLDSGCNGMGSMYGGLSAKDLCVKRSQNPTRSPLKTRSASHQASDAAKEELPASPPPPTAPPAPPAAFVENLIITKVTSMETCTTTIPAKEESISEMFEGTPVKIVEQSTPTRKIRGRSPFARRKKGLKFGSSESASANSKLSSIKSGVSDAVRSVSASAVVVEKPVVNNIRHHPCIELSKSERTFADCMSRLKELRSEMEKSTLVTNEQYDILFGNVQTIFGISNSLAVALQNIIDKNELESPAFSQVLLIYLPFLKNYFPYTKCASKAYKIFGEIKNEPEFIAVLKKMNTCANEVGGWFMTPFQRITRYPLLLEEILKHTPASHPDFAGVTEAFQGFKKLALDMNEANRSADQADLYREFVSKLSAEDAKLLEKKETDDTYHIHRKLYFNGSMRAAPKESLEEGAAMSSTDVLLWDLDSLIDSAAGAGAEELHHQHKIDFSNVVVIDADCIPHRTVQEAPSQPKKAPVDQGLHLFICDDIAIITFSNNKKLTIDCIIPLEQCWVIRDNEQLILAFPEGTRHMLVDESSTNVIADLDAKGTCSLQKCYEQFTTSIQARLKESSSAMTKRAQCSLFIENGERIVVN